MRLTMIHTADWHGELPAVPPCDILTISGDICNNYGKDNLDRELRKQAAWLKHEFGPHLKKQPVKWTLATWGNHDSVGYLADEYVSDAVPVFWLIDKWVRHRGITFYGTPWTRTYGHHCNFMLDDEARLDSKFENIVPCDVLISHGPPLNYGDLAPARPDVGQFEAEHCGSLALLQSIERVRPQLTVFGHVHPANGLYRHDGLPLANVAVVDAEFKATQRTLKPT
jgi:Icc-related predicted phosphoesterase